MSSIVSLFLLLALAAAPLSAGSASGGYDGMTDAMAMDGDPMATDCDDGACPDEGSGGGCVASSSHCGTDWLAPGTKRERGLRCDAGPLLVMADVWLEGQRPEVEFPPPRI